ncbi:hypothetical protein P7C71_g1557, partial [Lecanoromycetidae sp. Uapishka_2]
MITPPRTPDSSEEPASTIPVLITGGTGFLGAFIIDAVQEQHPEWAISVLDLHLPKVAKKNVNHETGDVTNAAYSLLLDMDENGRTEFTT